MRTTQPENFKKWLDALRSGKFAQGRNQLRGPFNQTYCCLGVACDISGLGRWNSTGYVVDGKGDEALPVRPVVEWLGIANASEEIITEIWKNQNEEWPNKYGTLCVWVKSQDGDEDPQETKNGLMSSVTVINDGGGSFDEIADRLEATYLG